MRTRVYRCMYYNSTWTAVSTLFSQPLVKDRVQLSFRLSQLLTWHCDLCLHFALVVHEYLAEF